MPERVLVIGSGLGSLSAAIRLARQGFEVKVFEKNSRPGGKMNQRRLGDFVFDTGPSLLTMPFVIDELFEYAGTSRKSYLEYVPLETICKYFFADGSILYASSDPERMKAEIHRLSPSDAKAYDDYMAYCRRIYDLTADTFLFSPMHEWRSLFNLRNFKTLLRILQIDPFRTVHQGVSRFFTDPRIVQIFDRYATYNGSNPYSAPATLNIIPHVEYGIGGFYIRGGMYKLVEALLDVAASLHVQIDTSAEVEKIVHHNKRIKGIVVNGETINADYVVCGQDVVTAHNLLLDDMQKRRQKLNKLEPSCSGYVALWGIDKTHSELEHHNIFFSRDYRKEFSRIFEELQIPEDPTIYISVTQKSDPTHAPDNCENWFVLLNMPYLHKNIDWTTSKSRLEKNIIAKLKQHNIDIAHAIAEKTCITPEDFHKLHYCNQGSIYGISSNDRHTAFKRPPNRSRDLAGLYFTGGSTHPGGGVPLVILSGRLTSDLIIANAN